VLAQKPGPTYVGTSWKMTKTLDESRAFARGVLEWGGWGESVTPFVLPTHVSLTAVRETVPRGSRLLVGAQNGHWAEEGAHTGEVSMRQLSDAGADLVEIGHSERRADHNESAEAIARKVHAALGAGLMPLVCVGEAQEVRDLGAHVDFVRGQALQALAGVDTGARARILLAYEPVWAIGDGGRSPKLGEIADVVSALSSDHRDIAGVLYGGSVTAANARDLLDLDGVSGLFVGRGAWAPSSFIDILRAAS
jgi:triosephosphate isomerase